MTYYKIHPAVGIARLGNSEEFYLEPSTIGGLPLQCDTQGNERFNADGRPVFVREFKSAKKEILRQGSKFRIYAYDEQGNAEEITLNSTDVTSISWQVHIANKKAGFWNFGELLGNTMIESDNTYENAAKDGLIKLRNPDAPDRQKLIIDPGPRTLTGANQKTEFSEATIPSTYQHGSFPGEKKYGLPIKTLGDMLTDAKGRLVVVAAFGNAGGDEGITSYAGADSWHDDTADGQVTCTLTIRGETHVLNAWVMCASPKYAPELVNISTIDDVMFDVAIRYKEYDPDIYGPKHSTRWNEDYIVNFDRDIAPIFNRPKDYQWVANVQAMMAFTNPPFDVRDNSAKLQDKRIAFFRYWRRPDGFINREINKLWDERLMPLMPLNSGTNSVTNDYTDKFLTLTQTQYFFLQQWSRGKFNNDENVRWKSIHPLDHASVGNCAGLPQSPGIEGTWNFNNPKTYSAPYRIWQAHDADYYNLHGLDPLRDETQGGGCEPGDLSKRMAIPWQADFFQCTVEPINFTEDNINMGKDEIPLPPTYYAYWWPPQAPWDVLTGSMTPEDQFAQGVPAGMQVNYARGVNSFAQMIDAWKYLGFIVNQNQSPDGRDYPYFVEKQRNDDKFGVVASNVVGASVIQTWDNNVFNPTWFLKDEYVPPMKPELSKRRLRVHSTFGSKDAGTETQK